MRTYSYGAEHINSNKTGKPMPKYSEKNFPTCMPPEFHYASF